MSGKKLFQVLRNIDPQLILDAAPKERPHVSRAWIKWGALAACLCLVATTVFLFLPNSPISLFTHTHAFSEWQSTKDATCVAQGEEMRVCACGEKEYRLTAILPHFAGKWVIEKEPIIREPTPEDPEAREPGLMCQFCHYCGAKLNEEIIPALGSLGLAYAVNLDGKTCTVVGIGNCIDTDIIIPPNFCGYHVTKIENSAFKDNTDITSVILPETLIAIGDYAFSSCTGLTEVVIPDSVTDIGANAFSECTGLIDLVISNSAVNIGASAFSACSGLTEIVIPDSVVDIGFRAFDCCLNVSSITLSQNLKHIGDGAFRGCSLVTSIAIPASVERIGAGIFEGCDALTDFYITDLASWCQINVEDPFDSNIYDNAILPRKLYLNGELLVNVEIPDGTNSIGAYAFYKCYDIVSVTVPSSVQTIGRYAFAECENLADISIANGVTSIGYYAFENCCLLTEITIPKSVTSIGDHILYGCIGLERISVPFLGYSADANSSGYGTNGKLTHLVNENHENLREVTLTASKKICDGAFGDWVGLTSVTLCEGIESIGYSAFALCKNLTNITIPSSVTQIGNSAFLGCSGLETVTLQEGLLHIGNAAFSSCIELKSIVIPDSVETIEACAFDYCCSLENVVLSKNLTEISNGLFAECEKLTKITLPNSIKRIGDSAFVSCVALKEIVFDGTEEQWNAIEKEEYWNRYSEDVEIVFTKTSNEEH